MNMTTNPGLERRLAALETEVATIRTANVFLRNAIKGLQDDAKFLRRTAITSMLSIFSAMILSLFALLLRKFGG